MELVHACVEPVAALRPLAIDVVSVQSQVVYGRVGNNVAVPALQAQGLSVAAVPTVVLSNTPHYPTVHGGVMPDDWFEGYLHDLSARGVLGELRAILTGYLGGLGQAQALASWIRLALETQADLRVVIDPVLGDHDHGKYVSCSLPDAYRNHLLSLADGLTPNGFELELLTGMPVNTVENVVEAARTLLTGRTQWVAVTSAAPDTWAPDQMQVALVARTGTELIRHPRIGLMPKGTGDLFCATLTGRWLDGAAIAQAAAQACEVVVQALRYTQQAQSAELLLPRIATARP